MITCLLQNIAVNSNDIKRTCTLDVADVFEPHQVICMIGASAMYYFVL